jgi:hypothetical protein
VGFGARHASRKGKTGNHGLRIEENDREGGIKMKIVIKLFLVAALVLLLATHSLGNGWAPNDMIEAAYSSALQTDRLVMKNDLKFRSADISLDFGKAARQGAKPVVQQTPMNEWVPFDVLRTWVFPLDP